MTEAIKKKLVEILEVVKICPPNLQEKCFEILLAEEIKKIKETKDSGQKTKVNAKALAAEEEIERSERPLDAGEEIQLKDLHTVGRKFAKKVGLETINNIFYLEGDDFKPLYDDLKSTKMSDSQIRVALLEALKNGLKNGEFKFNVDLVRELCDKVYKCYDGPNFSATFKRNKDLFLDQYNSGDIRLSAKGKEKLEEIIKQL